MFPAFQTLLLGSIALALLGQGNIRVKHCLGKKHRTEPDNYLVLDRCPDCSGPVVVHSHNELDRFHSQGPLQGLRQS